MTLEPLLAAPATIQAHTFAALAAFGLGALQLSAPKGTPLHRGLGYVWVTIMLVVAISSFFIHTIRLIGPFSPIHLLSILTLVTLPLAVLRARRGDIAGHRKLMRVLFSAALLIAGLFTLLPGRIMSAVVFGP